jgi:ATP-dependent Lhr-like helicase
MAPPPPPPDSGSAFELLAEGVQRQLYRMRWTSLRPVQVEAIRTYFGSSGDMLIMAETAGGKTEAAFLPVLSSISQEATGSVRAVYVGPLKALINDQFGRLEELCTYLDMPVHRWHGDVPASRKEQLLREPSGVLLITPESLESLLINRTRHLPGLFGGLRAVVIDEVHSFLDTERGMHLASLLVRIKRYRGASEPATRTIGLSATVGDVGVAQRYLAPDAPERVAIISDLGGTKELQFRIHGYLKPESSADNPGSGAEGHASEPRDGDLKLMGAIAADLVEHCRASSNLVFANAKGDIELYVDLANEHCRAAGLPESFLVHHGSLAREVREDTEQAMKSGGMFTTVCSSTLEMGIDIGSVRMVGQVGAPWSVASLKQRAGRSGRKETDPRRLRMYVACDSQDDPGDPTSVIPIDLLQSIAACELMLVKWIEPQQPARMDLSTLTQQIISTIAEVGAVSAAALFHRLCVEGPFRGFNTALFARVLRRLGAEDVIEQGSDGLLILGLEGEHIRKQRDFYAAFASQAEFTLIAGNRPLGTLPMSTLPKVGEHIVFAARRWQVADIDEKRRVLQVVRATRRQRPHFTGSPGEVHPRIREEMLRVLAGSEIPVYLDPVAAAALQTARSRAAAGGLAVRRLIPLSESRTMWMTWTGTAAQRTLRALLACVGVEAADQKVALECSISAPELARRLATVAQSLPAPLQLAQTIAPKHFRKYDALFDDELLEEAIAADRLDWPSTLQVLRCTQRQGADADCHEGLGIADFPGT